MHSITATRELWRTIWEFPRYEISNQGNVRTKDTLTPMTTSWSKNSLCVNLYKNGSHYRRRLWKLMERYWSKVEYPEEWKAPKPVTDPETDGRCKLTQEQYDAIKESTGRTSDLAWAYELSERQIKRIRYGK